MAGEVVHVEFPATDIDRAQRFWSAVFGWSFGDSVMPGMDYRMAQVNDNAGVALMPGETGHPELLLRHRRHRRVDRDRAGARWHGARTSRRSRRHGWFAACADSEGNAFYLWQSDSAAG